MGPSIFGNICLTNNLKLGTPIACAAITYSWFLTVITCPLTILAIVSHSTAPIAIKSNQIFLPKITINKIIKMMKGSP